MADETFDLQIIPYGCECDRCERGAMGDFQMWSCRFTGRVFQRIDLEMVDENGDLYMDFGWMEVVQGGED